MSSDKVIALVLAAGFSRRFGSDKRVAILKDGRGLLQTTLQCTVKSYETVLVVLQINDDPYILGVPDGIPIVRASSVEFGLGSSLAAGVKSVVDTKLEGDAIAVILGDMPLIDQSTHISLSNLATSGNIVRPRFEGKYGHPVLFGRIFWPELERLKGDSGGIVVIENNSSSCTELDVSDSNVIKDIDTVANVAEYEL